MPNRTTRPPPARRLINASPSTHVVLHALWCEQFLRSPVAHSHRTFTSGRRSAWHHACSNEEQQRFASPRTPARWRNPPEPLPVHGGGGLRTPPRLPQLCSLFTFAIQLRSLSSKPRATHASWRAILRLNARISASSDRLRMVRHRHVRLLHKRGGKPDRLVRANPSTFRPVLPHLATDLKHIHNMLCARA